MYSYAIGLSLLVGVALWGLVAVLAIIWPVTSPSAHVGEKAWPGVSPVVWKGACISDANGEPIADVYFENPTTNESVPHASRREDELR